MGVRSFALVVAFAGASGCARGHVNEAAPPVVVSGSSERATLPVVLHFASRSEQPVVDPAQVGEWLAKTQMLMRPHGVDVELRTVEALPPGARAAGVLRRYKLLDEVPDDGALHVMIVDELGGVRRDGRETVRGLHFEAPLRGTQYVAVGPDATTSTLAHEIGHALGLGHESDANNVMCSCDRSDDPSFSPRQGRKLRRALVGR